MQHTIKPKLGNAALIFAENSAPSSGPSNGWFSKRPWFGQMLMVVSLFVAAGIVVALNTPELDELYNNPTSKNTIPHTNIDIVETKHKGDMLVGTLIRSEEQKDMIAISEPNESVTLTPRERERLLQIINN